MATTRLMKVKGTVYELFESAGPNVTTVTAYTNIINTTTASILAGLYEVKINFSYNIDTNASDGFYDVTIDGTSVSSQEPMHEIEPKDNANGPNGAVPGTASGQRLTFSRSYYVNLTAGTHNVIFRQASETGGIECSSWDISILLTRII